MSFTFVSYITQIFFDTFHVRLVRLYYMVQENMQVCVQETRTACPCEKETYLIRKIHHELIMRNVIIDE